MLVSQKNVTIDLKVRKSYYTLPCLAVANSAGAGTNNLSSTRHHVVSSGGGSTTSEISQDSTTCTAATEKKGKSFII